MDIQPVAFRRQTDQAYIARRDDGSHETRFYHEMVDGDEVTLFHGRGPADFRAELINSVRKSQALRSGAANDAVPMMEAA